MIIKPVADVRQAMTPIMLSDNLKILVKIGTTNQRLTR